MGSASLNPSEIFRHFTCAVVLTEGEAAAGDVLLESIKKAKLTTAFMSHPLEAWAGLLRLELLGADADHGAQRRTALFVLDRDAWDDLSLLFSKVRELLPNVSVWIIADALAIEVYSGFTHSAGVSTPVALDLNPPATNANNGLRIVGTDADEPRALDGIEVDLIDATPASEDNGDEDDAPEHDPDATPTTAVSSEELAMLLEMFPDEPARGNDEIDPRDRRRS